MLTNVHRLPFAFLILLAIGVLTIFGVVTLSESRRLASSEPPQTPSVLETDPAIGSSNPSVIIIEFGDFECPACAAVAPVLKEVIRRYPGEVRLVWKDFPVTAEHPNAGQAAEAGRCATEQGKFWLMHDKLFETSGSFSPERAVEAGKAVELDVVAFTTCLGSGRTKPLIEQSFQEGRSLGVFSTPTFFVNGVRYETLERFEEFRQVIEDRL